MDYKQESWFRCKNLGNLALLIFTASGGHLGFPDFYESDFDRLFLIIAYIQ